MTRLTDEEWAWVQTVLPIAVVDVFPLDSPDLRVARVGLIRRKTPHQGERWNLIGGRVHYGETLGAAIEREVQGALGDNVRLTVGSDEQPIFVAQYAPLRVTPFSYDPRKHAVGMTYLLPITGAVKARGEALDFGWFSPTNLPRRSEWGFEQDRVAEACLRRAGILFSFNPG